MTTGGKRCRRYEISAMRQPNQDIPAEPAGYLDNAYPAYLAERFPTEVRTTAGGFVYHQGAIFGGLVGPILAYLATSWNIGFAIPMLIGTTVGCVSLIMAILFSPETRGKVLVAD